MPSPPLLDYDALAAPISGENPAGDSVPFGTRKKLDEFRKEVNPELFAADDPMRPEAPKFADWPEIIKLAKDTLADTSKDLLVSARLTEALTKQHGFAGLRDGLKVMKLLLTEGWDRIYPSIEDGDLEVRAAAFNWLDDVDRGARFPNSIRMIPFLIEGGFALSWQDWRNVMDGKGTIDRQKLDQVILNMTVDQCQTTVDDLRDGLKELDVLAETLHAKLAELAPGMVEIRRAMNECLALAEQILQRKAPATQIAVAAPAAVAVAAAEGNVARVSIVDAPARRSDTREDLYAQLNELSTKLLHMDPHSPVTYMVQRAVRLSKMTLPQLIKALIRDSNSLTELNRDLDLGYDGDHPS